MRIRDGAVERLLHVRGRPVLVRARRAAGGSVVIRAEALDPRRLAGGEAAGTASREDLAVAIERLRFTLWLDDDLSELYARFRSDPLIGPAIRRAPWTRPRRHPWPWEALAWAIVEQLIDSGRAARIKRRIVGRWGARVAPDATSGASVRSATRGVAFRTLAPRRASRGAPRGPATPADVPGPEVIAARAPAELAALDLSPGRSLALIAAAREVAAGRADLLDPGCDRRLLAIRGIGPWTVQCLDLGGRGDPDALPAGDLAYVKLVGRLAGLGRRATTEEVESFFAPYEPYRGLAARFALAGHHGAIPAGPPLRRAA